MYTDITSTEKALEKLGLDPNSKPEITGISEKHAQILSAVYESLVISEAIREEWEPDYDNQTEKKFEPWYWADAPGFRFHGSHCTHTRTIAALGPSFAKNHGKNRISLESILPRYSNQFTTLKQRNNVQRHQNS